MNVLATFDETLALSIPNEGTLPTPALIEITMTTDSPTGVRVTLTDHIEIETALLTGNEVDMDTNARTVKVNGADARDDLTYSSVYFKLPVGNSILTVAPVSTTQATFRERYI